MGSNKQFALKKFLQSHFPKKVLFFWKSDFMVITQNWWHFLNKYMSLFCLNKKFCHGKNVVKSIVLVSMGCGRGLICKNIDRWKNYALCIFSKVNKKLEVNKKRKTSDRAYLKNARLDVFGFFITYHFLITFEKNTQGILFSTLYIFAYITLTKIFIEMFYYFFLTFRINAFLIICWFFTGQYAHVVK